MFASQGCHVFLSFETSPNLVFKNTYAPVILFVICCNAFCCECVLIFIQYNTGQSGGTAGNDINVVPVWIEGVTGYQTTALVVDNGEADRLTCTLFLLILAALGSSQLVYASQFF